MNFNNRLVAISYRGGFGGTLLSKILELSPEVARYTESTEIKISNFGDAHYNAEKWFVHMHDDYQATLTDKTYFLNSMSLRLKQELEKDSKKLIIFRIHPNMTEKLDFIEDLRIIHIYSNNDLQYLRYGYEKIIKPRGDQVYIRFNRQRNLGFDIIDEEIKRKILVDWINEKVFPVENIRNQYKNNLFELNISEFLDPLQTESSYTRLCNFLSITECTKKSTEIIKEYLVAQPTRF